MSQPPVLAASVKGEAMPRLRHAVTILFSGVVGSLAGLLALAGPAMAQDPAPDHGGAGTAGTVVGSIPATSTASSGDGLGWWAILLIVVGAVLLVAVLAELTRVAVRHHHVAHPAM